MNNSIFFKYCLLGAVLSFLGMAGLKSQTVVFPRDFSPAGNCNVFLFLLPGKAAQELLRNCQRHNRINGKK